MTGVIRLVSPQPMAPAVLLPPSGLPHSWGLLSQVLAVVLQVQVQVQVQVCVCACVCACGSDVKYFHEVSPRNTFVANS